MPVFESSRKVQVFGSSLAVTLPSLFVKACEIEKGVELDVLFGLDGVLVIFDLMESIDLRDRLLLILEKLDEKIRVDEQTRGPDERGSIHSFSRRERK